MYVILMFTHENIYIVFIACGIFHIPYFLDPAVVGSQEWQALYTKLLRFPGNISHSYLRDKRFVIRPMTSSPQVRKRITDVILQIQTILKIKIIVIEIFFLENISNLYRSRQSKWSLQTFYWMLFSGCSWRIPSAFFTTYGLYVYNWEYVSLHVSCSNCSYY